jgi:hypothetical protein
VKKIFSILFALVLVVGLGLAITAPVVAEPGTTYYVSATGDDDTGDGTVGNPWRTIQKAIDALNVTGDGDTIMVAAGEYDAFLVEDRANITITSTEGATITTAVFVSDVGGPIEEGWVMAGVSGSENINIQGVNFDATAISEEVIVGIGYLDSTGVIAALTVENVLGTAGVVIADDAGFSDVEITGCNISNNNGIGIIFSTHSTQEAHFNNIFGNSNGGVLKDGEATVDATYNWWGHASGPFHPSDNPDGIGNPVSNGVDFDPWLEAAPVIQTIVDGGTITALAAADIIVDVTGTATIVISKYDSDPHAEALALRDAPASLDLLQADDWIALDIWRNVVPIYYENDTVLSIELYYTDAELAQAAVVAGRQIDEATLRLRWWEPDISDYADCVPEGDVETETAEVGYSGYMWVELDSLSYPSLEDAKLSIETFGGYGHPSTDFDGMEVAAWPP